MFMASSSYNQTPLVAADASAPPVNDLPLHVDDIPSKKWTVGQLKEYLKSHGGKLSGRKGDLLER